MFTRLFALGIFFTSLLLSMAGCGILNPEQGSLKISLVEENKLEKSTWLSRELRIAQCLVKKGNSTIRHLDLRKENNYFNIEITDLPLASNYSVFLFGKEYRPSYIGACASQSRIEIKDGETATIQLNWSPFMTALIAPIEGNTVEGNTIRLKWRSVNEADYYDLMVANDSTFNQTIVYSKVIGDEYAIDSQLLKKGRYYWKVRCVGRWNYGNKSLYADDYEKFYCSGAWSEIAYFIYN